MKTFKLFIFVFIPLGLTACPWEPAPKAAERPFTIASWNVQTLFDGIEQGNEYADFAAKKGWNGEKYRKRLKDLGSAILSMDGADDAEDNQRGPEVLALMEVENAGVVHDLASQGLKGAGYNYTSFAGNEGHSLGVGLISRHALGAVISHSILNYGELSPRPLLEVEVLPAAKAPLRLFVCHWKSKLGGDEETESRRRDAAKVLVRRIKELQKEDPGIHIVVLGDLNENFDEWERVSKQYITALLPDSAEAAELASLKAASPDGVQDYIVLSGSKPPLAKNFGKNTLALYAAWFGAMGHDGSYYYKASWESIDHAFFNAAFFDGKHWENPKVQVLAAPPFMTSKGTPFAYRIYNESGLSDHLPLFVTLQYPDS